MQYLLLFVLLSGQNLSHAQYFSGSKVIDGITEGKFYFVGQLHCNQANTIIEKELLFALNNKYGVQYNVLEYGHSIAFLINEYLKTGQDSFLTYINPTAKFSFIKTVKAHNDSVRDDKKIKFFGVDFENRYDGKFTRYAIQIITKRATLPENKSMFQLLQLIIKSKPEEMEVRLKKLRVYLSENLEECRLLLNDYFIDLLLIANAHYHFSPNRDKSMINNFKILYSELLRTNDNPSFFASFGTGHINPSNKKSIAMRLLNDNTSPVLGKVNIIGVQYFDSGFYKDSVSNPSDGNLSFLCKNATLALQPFVDFNRHPTISFISREALTNINCNKALNTFSGLLVIQNFGNTILCDWQ